MRVFGIETHVKQEPKMTTICADCVYRQDHPPIITKHYYGVYLEGTVCDSTATPPTCSVFHNTDHVTGVKTPRPCHEVNKGNCKKFQRDRRDPFEAPVGRSKKYHELRDAAQELVREMNKELTKPDYHWSDICLIILVALVVLTILLGILAVIT